jgi:acetyl esterase/lipase
VVETEDIASVAAIGSECLSGFGALSTGLPALLKINSGKFLAHDPVRVQPWAQIITDNTPGKMKAGAPVFIAQGSADTVVDPPVTTKFAIELCGQGTSVTFHEVPDAAHDVIAVVSAKAAVDWMAARFAGHTPTDDCIRK